MFVFKYIDFKPEKSAFVPYLRIILRNVIALITLGNEVSNSSFCVSSCYFAHDNFALKFVFYRNKIVFVRLQPNKD